MSGVDAAATLSLRIDTDKAKKDIGELRAEYRQLRQELGADLKIGTVGNQIKDLQASLSAVGAGVLSVNKALDDIVRAGGKFTNSLVAGAKEATASMVTLTDVTKANAAAAAASGSAAAARILKERAEGANLAAAAEARLAQASAASISAAQSSSNAAAARILKERAEAANLAAEAELRLTAATKANTTAAQAAYLANQQRLAQERTALKSGQSVSAYNSLMNTTSVAVGASKPTDDLVDANKRLAPAIKEAAASQLNWNKVAHEGHSAVRGLSGSLGTLWITYGSLVPLLTGAALGSAFVNAAKMGSEFAYQLTFVKALGDESAEAIQRLSDSAIALSQTGLKGPTEIASGYRILAQAGLDAAQALEAMPHVLNLATVGEMEMEQAATTLVGVMNAFSLTVEKSEHVGDIFAKAAALSQTSVQGMTEAMKTASVVGEQYGASIEDTAAALTLLAKVNITGTAAGTSFRNMLKELYAPVPQAAAAMEKLGLKTKDLVTGELRNFADIIFELKEKLQDFSKGDQVEILQRLFGERGAKEAVAMLTLTKDKWVELRDSIANSKGFMEGVSTELENTAKGKWAQAINTMKSQLVKAFQEMEPVFSQLADNFKTLFSDPAFVDGLKAIVSGMASLTNALVQMAPNLYTLAQAWVVYKAAMIGASVWSATSAAVVGFTASMQAASGIIGPALGPMNTLKGVVAGLPSLLLAIPSPLAIIAGALAAGAVAWTLWGDKASRAGDKAYDAATRAQAALDKVSRREKYGVGDLAEAQEELDKAESLLGLRNQSGATGTALSDARAAVDKWGKVVAALENEKYKAVNAVDGLKEATTGNTKPTRKASDILGEDKKDKKGSSRGDLKDYRSILNDNLASGLKQEQIQLARELIEIETQVAAQVISTVEAIRQKNQATEDSIEIERLWIEASLADAKAANDRVAIAKFQNDLDENTVKMERQKQQALLDNTKAYTAEQNAIQNISIATSRYIEDLELERIALDMTAAQVAQLRIEREALRATEDLNLKVSRKQIEPEEAAAAQAAIEARAGAQKEDDEYRRSYVGGWKKAYKEWADNATDAAKQAADSFAIMSTAMDRALDEFLSTGKLNFADFAKSVILEIAKIEAKALAAKATAGTGGFGGIISSILGMFGGGGGGFSASDFANLAGSFIDSAKGNVFSGSPSLHQYANTVQSTPKTFAFQNLHGFAKGGVFAEAGPEAVMPLARDNMGRLGVRAQTGGGDGGNVFNITVNVNGNANAQDVRRSAGQGTREALAAFNTARRYA